jgi:hypothetical protein
MSRNPFEDPVKQGINALARELRMDKLHFDQLCMLLGFAVDKNGQYYHLACDVIEFRKDFHLLLEQRLKRRVKIRELLMILRKVIGEIYNCGSEKERKLLLNYEHLNYYQMLVDHYFCES